MYVVYELNMNVDWYMYVHWYSAWFEKIIMKATPNENINKSTFKTHLGKQPSDQNKTNLWY